MKRWFLFLFLLCPLSVLSAQKIIREYHQVSLSEVLRDLNRIQDSCIINFMYDELEDYSVTAEICANSIIDAVRQAVGIYPIRILRRGGSELYIECVRKREQCFTGKVVDEENKSIAFANVAVFNLLDSTLLGGGLSGERGEFSIPIKSSPVLVKISHVGYRTAWRVCDMRKSETFCLQPEDQQMKDVLVDGQTPVLYRKVGTIVFDTRHVVGALNAMDLLRHSPGVLLEHDNITLLGAKGIVFCINGKEQNLGNKEMLQILKSYSANDVEKIEITQAPEARFSATGNAGVINLVLRKRTKDYVGGTVGYAHTQYEEHGDEANANIAYNKGRLLTSFNVVGTWDKTRYQETNAVVFKNFIRENKDNGLVGNNNYLARCQLDYSFSGQFLLSAYVMYANGKRQLGTDGTYDYGMSDGTNTIVTKTCRNEETKTYAINVNATHKPNGDKVRIDYNLDCYRMKMGDSRLSEAVYVQTGTFPDEFNKKNEIEQVVANYSAKVDVNVVNFRCGAQYAFTRSNRKLTDSWAPGYSEWSTFLYDEKVLSAYSEYQGKLGRRVSLNLGGRYEQTWTTGQIRPIEFVPTQRTCYGRFFPSVGVAYKPGELHSLYWSLGSRIIRPNIINVNPDTLYYDACYASSGNPLLKPTFLYKTMMNYTYRNVLGFDLYYSFQPERMTQMSYAGGQTIFSTWGNMVDEQELGINSFCSFTRLRWMNASLMQGVYWRKFKGASRNVPFGSQGWSYTGKLYTSFFFDEERRWMASLNTGFVSCERDVNKWFDARYRIDVGAQYRFRNERLVLGFSCLNLLASRIKGREFLGSTTMDFDNKFNYRQFLFTFSYNWGTGLRQRRTQGNSEELQKRVVNDLLKSNSTNKEGL